MRTIIFFSLMVLMPNHHSFAQVIEWAKASHTSTATNGTVYQPYFIKNELFTTENGDIYTYGVGGRYNDFDFDNTNIVGINNYFGNFDIFLAKYNALGSLQSAKNTGSPQVEGTFDGLSNLSNNEFKQQQLVYKSGFLYCVGYFSDTADVDFSANTPYLIANNSTDYTSFIAKYDTSGVLVWIKPIRTNSPSNGNPDDTRPYINILNIQNDNTIAIDVNTKFINDTNIHTIDNVAFRGNLVANLDINTGNISKIIRNTPLEYKPIAGTNIVAIKTMQINTNDAAGNFYALNGNFLDSTDINIRYNQPPNWVINQVPNAMRTVFAKYDTNNQIIWSGQIGGVAPFSFGTSTNKFAINSLKIGINNDLFVVGHYNNAADFDMTLGTYIVSHADTNMYVFTAKYNNMGNLLWVRTERVLDKNEYAPQPDVIITNTQNVITYLNYNDTTNTTSANTYLFKYNNNGTAVGSYSIDGLYGSSIFDNINDNGFVIIGQKIGTGNVDMNLDTNGVYLLNGAMQGNEFVIAKYKNWAVATHDLSQNNITLFPNPATHIIHIRTNAPAHISIYDITGKQVRTAHTATPTTDIDVNNLPSGIYTVKIVANKTTQAKKLVVVH